MEHVVFFPAQDGTPAFRRVATLAEAVRLVENLRNVEGATEVSVHALTEVPLAFKTWYRVELPDAVEGAPADPPADPIGVEPAAGTAAPAAVPAQPEAPAEPAPAEQAEAGKAGAASLGFFAR